jgi:hypothetical protein
VSPRTSKTEPQILEMPDQKMAVARGTGAPDKVFAEAMPALYGAVYTLKFSLKKQGLESFKVGALRARYPDAVKKDKKDWTIIMGIPIPGDTKELFQKVPGVPVSIETWKYGTVAQVLHLGAYDRETENIKMLLAFIEEQGYKIAGDHEEEYLTRPDAKVVKTIIRYPVSKK